MLHPFFLGPGSPRTSQGWLKDIWEAFRGVKAHWFEWASVGGDIGAYLSDYSHNQGICSPWRCSSVSFDTDARGIYDPLMLPPLLYFGKPESTLLWDGDKDIPPAHSTSWWVNNKVALTGVGFFLSLSWSKASTRESSFVSRREYPFCADAEEKWPVSGGEWYSTRSTYPFNLQK